LSFIDRLLGREERAVSFQTIWGAGDFFEDQSLSATVVNPETALQINAVYSAVSLISDTISTLPIDAYIRRGGARYPLRPRPAWVLKPDVDTTKEAFYGAMIVSLLIDGNIFVRKYRNNRGELVNMVVLNPMDVEIKRSGIGRVLFVVKGEEKALTSEEIMFIPDVVRPGQLRGVARVEALKENFGLAMALENYAARFFGSGTQTSGVIELPEGVPLTAEQAKEMQRAFDSRHKGWGRAHKTAVLTGGAVYKPTNVPNDQAQFLDSRRMAVEDVARAFNIPPHLLGLPGTNTYASVEQNNIAFVTHTLRPIAAKIESAMTDLLSQQTGLEAAFVKISLDGLLRADITARTAAYSTMLQAGVYSINEVRSFEDLRPIDDDSANTTRVPLANVNLDAADLSAMSQKVEMAQRLIQVGFDPSDVMAKLELPDIDHTGKDSVQLQPDANTQVSASEA
jgi:HK97 family phage portal protein